MSKKEDSVAKMERRDPSDVDVSSERDMSKKEPLPEKYRGKDNSKGKVNPGGADFF